MASHEPIYRKVGAQILGVLILLYLGWIAAENFGSLQEFAETYPRWSLALKLAVGLALACWAFVILIGERKAKKQQALEAEKNKVLEVSSVEVLKEPEPEQPKITQADLARLELALKESDEFNATLAKEKATRQEQEEEGQAPLRLPIQEDWREYVQDEIEGIHWEWDWYWDSYSSEYHIAKPRCFCPRCQSPLKLVVDRQSPAHTFNHFYCNRCNKYMSVADGSADDRLDAIKDEINRRIRTNSFVVRPLPPRPATELKIVEAKKEPPQFRF